MDPYCAGKLTKISRITYHHKNHLLVLTKAQYNSSRPISRILRKAQYFRILREQQTKTRSPRDSGVRISWNPTNADCPYYDIVETAVKIHCQAQTSIHESESYGISDRPGLSPQLLSLTFPTPLRKRKRKRTPDHQLE